MDTNRIIINNIDLSTTTIETATEISGLTVIKAPKGPVRPIRIPANSEAKIQDIFGVNSENYPEIYEARIFNTGYDTYIAAPYTYGDTEDGVATGTRVPRALITDRGVFVHSDLVPYDKPAEDFALTGIDPDLDFEKGGFVFKTPTDGSLLYDTKYCKDLLDGFENVKDGNKEIFYFEDKGLCIHTGCRDLFTKLQNNSVDTFRFTNLPFKLNNKNYIDFTVEEYTGTDEEWKDSIVFNIPLIIDGTPTTKPAGKIVETDTESLIYISGANVPEAGPWTTYFSKNLLKAYFTEAKYCKALGSYWLYNIEGSDVKVYGIIYPKYPSERRLHISFDAFDNVLGYRADIPSCRNLLKMSVYEDGAFHDITHKVGVTGSLEKTALNSQGIPVGFTSVNSSYVNQELICVYVLDHFKNVGEIKNPEIKNLPEITLEGGIRDLPEDDVELHNISWDYIKENPEDYTDVDIFFEAQRHEVVVDSAGVKAGEINGDSYFSLSEMDSFVTSCFYFNYTVEPGVVLNLTKKLEYNPLVWNVLNEGVVELTDGSKFITPLTGPTALMEATILENRWGGVAPMWLNIGTPGMGGQITAPGVTKLRFKYNKDQLSRLDDLNFNPVIYDRTYGLMLVGQKTCKSGDITDWSYIGHVASFINLEKEIKVNVMIPQIGKPNNDYYRTLRKEQVNQLLRKRITGNNRIWTDASCDTSTADGINDIETQRKRQFKIQVKVKPSTYSETVILDFMNLDRDMEV